MRFAIALVVAFTLLAVTEAQKKVKVKCQAPYTKYKKSCYQIIESVGGPSAVHNACGNDIMMNNQKFLMRFMAANDLNAVWIDTEMSESGLYYRHVGGRGLRVHTHGKKGNKLKYREGMCPAFYIKANKKYATSPRYHLAECSTLCPIICLQAPPAA